jgi:hypothetical protein
MNDLFGAESFTASQIRELQFLESPDFQADVTDASRRQSGR